MKERLIEFQDEMYDVEWREFTEKQLKKWKKDWDNYIAKGGVRPGRPH